MMDRRPFSLLAAALASTVTFGGLSRQFGGQTALLPIRREQVRLTPPRIVVRNKGEFATHFYGKPGWPRRRPFTIDVPLLRGYHVDRSKYSGAALRQIRATRGCGRPPKKDLATARSSAAAQGKP